MPEIPPIQAFALGADAVYLSHRPPPTAPDGHYDWQTPSDANMSLEGHSAVTNLLTTVKNIKDKGPVRLDPSLIDGFIDSTIHPGAEDDREGAFSSGLTVLSRLPPSSGIKKKMSDAVVGMLYNTVPHPPSAYLGEAHTFRQADGGGNNLSDPDIGRAGTHYSRSVQSKWCNDTTNLPAPSLVFDTLLKRRTQLEHPNGNASFTFAFASLVTHSLFRTDYKDWTINNTSSYLDLSPLYGINQSTQDQVRDKASGRGLLYPDTFSEERLVFLPPAASAILVILSRNHNVSSLLLPAITYSWSQQYIAEMILKINEKGKWSDPPPEDAALRAKQDEEIFQTTRLINCGHFMSLIMGDYVAGFLGLSEGNAWNLDAFDPIKPRDGPEIGRGEGNHCSVEFNVVYRWHATTSAKDEKWTEDFLNSIVEGKPLDTVNVEDFKSVFGKVLANMEHDPKKRTFGGITRGPDGKFKDDDLSRILQDATADPAGAYGAGRTPASLRVIEILGLEQARTWGVCTMNEFRAYLGLKKFKSFEEWNPDPQVANAARRLYNHIDDLELYTGLQCESTMPLSGGLRFACGYTMTRAILSDAIALVRGDRFNTTSFTPGNLTTWGYQDTLRNPNNGGLGGQMPKLLTRHLPRHYPFNSVYSCFPFFTPKKMQDSLTKQGVATQYTFDRPVPTNVPKVLNTVTAINYVFKDPGRFNNVYDMKGLGDGYGFILAFDDAARHDRDKALAVHALFPDKDSIDQYRAWYRNSIITKIREKSWKYDGVPGIYVDIVSDVINATSIHWAADVLCGIPIKTKDNLNGLYTVQEVYDMFSVLFTLTFLAIGDNENGFSLRWTAAQSGGVIQALIAKALLEVSPNTAPNIVTGVISKINSIFWPASNKPYFPFLSRLAESGRPINELVATVVGLAIGASVNFAQAAVNVVDFYLDEEHNTERQEIITLTQFESAENTELLRGYVREAFRLNPQFQGLWRRSAVKTTINQGDGFPAVHLEEGDIIWASLRNAQRNPADFPNPTKVDPTRPRKNQPYFGSGFHVCAGVDMAEQTITDIVKTIFQLKNLRRAPGPAGTLKGIKQVVNDTETHLYVMPNGTLTPWPSSMHLVYDD
ncbi:heme peroxidase [Collybia nuda]|uniref:Heme peroxidase n=1 Tax=Collybia nuda TaxID=64659 RepID=A0A9P5XYE0_9AGAR|nr:heme peroxidase [Collybia nuda]